MCSVCEFRASQAAPRRAPGEAGAATEAELAAVRCRRLGVVSAMLAPMDLRVTAGPGGALTLTAASGDSRTVAEAEGVWPAAEALTGRRFDPLAPAIDPLA